MMTIEKIAKSVCPDYMVGTYKVEDRTFIASSLEYPNGDHICAYLVQRNDVYSLTDLGVTSHQLRASGIELTDRRKDAITYLINANDMRWDGSELVKPIAAGESPGEAFRKFCDTIGRISTMEYERDPHTRSTYDAKVDLILKTKLPKTFDVRHHFFDEKYDPEHLYPIDWAIFNGRKRRHIFAVGGRESALMVPATVHYFSSLGVKSPTLSLIAPDVHLGKKIVSRLQHASDQILFRDVSQYDVDLLAWLDKAA